jgi:hypothetical protein
MCRPLARGRGVDAKARARFSPLEGVRLPKIYPHGNEMVAFYQLLN